MLRQIRSSQEIMTYAESDKLCDEISAILEKYMDFNYYAREYIKSEKRYDGIRYTYGITSGYRDSSGYCEIIQDDYGDWKTDINAMKNEIRKLLRSKGFTNIKFYMYTRKTEEHYTGDWGTVVTKFRYLHSIDFDYML